jgi:hypothetical protein
VANVGRRVASPAALAPSVRLNVPKRWWMLPETFLGHAAERDSDSLSAAVRILLQSLPQRFFRSARNEG